MAARVAIIALVVALVITAVLLARGLAPAPVTAPIPTPQAPASQAPGAEAPGVEAPASSEPAGTGAATVVVHVAGAVREPGVVNVPEGTRVAEVIDVAGGAAEGADLDAINLASTVTDGQQVYVPQQGEAARPEPGTTPASSTIDVNTADAATLEQLPGIGPALAAEIIGWREQNGPFATVEDLLQVSGIGPATLERLRDEVVL
ncbi:helix-hairpin-helix domain-containing protein [Ruania suaedae]|uniref:helix-hairpin-helix domain-containing protein n=1 Tax=Ruania suaedae TaxID=2897774 RepID=UPI001E35D254|nr:helix-hairpin-helix domain-containing protein [Ruania suaedae]UFU01762.1 helix-hairpin-helix domain-containing protein [Ruania suaedae]